MDAQTDRWLASMPEPDTPQHVPAESAPTWEAWVAEGRSIPGIEATLAEALADEPDEFRRAQVAVALGVVGGVGSVAPLIRTLRDDAPPVAMEAAAALGRLGRTEAVEPLCDALDDADVNIRANAATALGRFDDETARGCLDRAGRDPDKFVRAAAEAARQGR